jgi:hypothetical protein
LDNDVEGYSNEIGKSKDICNFVPLIEVFMQEWFLGEETPKQVTQSSSRLVQVGIQ